MGDQEYRVGISETCKFTGSSAPSIWRWVKAGTFPTPIYIRGRRTWTVAQLRAWIEAEAARPQRRGGNLVGKPEGEP